MLAVLLLVVVAAMAWYEPWSPALLVPDASSHPGTGDAGRAQPPNDWGRLFVGVLYRLGGNGGERHPA